MTHLRLRVKGLSTEQWLQYYEKELAASGVVDKVELKQPKKGTGLAALDPQVLSAIIQGGATIVGAALTAFIAAYVVLKTSDRKPNEPALQINVTLQLSSETRYLTIGPEHLGKLGKVLSETADDFQQIREVSITENKYE
ncbi:MAG: hypothetical protein WBP93_21580 [Pyrinomonadaceae bacterium]